MSFLAPTTALIAASVAIPSVVLLYFLKLRRRVVTISSTLLWRKAIQDQQVNAPFQRLRRNLLLFIQLLILACLLLAFARPTLRTTAHPGQRVVILVDHSASMNATDGDPTRLDHAKRIARDLVDNLTLQDDGSPGSSTQEQGATGGMVIGFAQRARVVQPFTTDPVLLRRAINSIEPTDQLTHLADALKLVEPFALRGKQLTVESEQPASLIVYVISDGKHQHRLPLSLTGADVRYIQVGTPEANNVGITSLTARRHLRRPQWVQVYAEVSSTAMQPTDTNVTLQVNGRTQNVTTLQLPAATDDVPGTQPIKFDLPLLDTALIKLTHDTEDALAADNTAHLVVAPPRRLRVLLVTPGNAFLEHALQASSPRDLVRMSAKRYEDQDPQYLRRTTTDQGFDVIVFDRYSPEQIPPVSSLYFAASPGIEGLNRVSKKPQEESTSPASQLLDWDRDHPLLRYVALDDVLIVDSARLALPDHARALATSQAGPVMATVPAGPTRHVVVAFDVLQTNWPMHISFPVFVGNAMNWLSLTGSAHEGISFYPGSTAVLPIAAAADLVYQGPESLPAQPDNVTRSVILPAFRAAGLYTASQQVPEPWDHLAVNLTNVAESDLRPAGQLEIGSAPAQATAAAALVRREVWPWFVAGALALLMVEWLVYTRRMHL